MARPWKILRISHFPRRQREFNEFLTLKPRDNIDVKCDTIAGVLNLMLEEGRLIRLRKGEQKVLWSLAEDGNRKRIKSEVKPLKTGSQNQKETGTGLFSTGTERERKIGSGKPPPNPNSKAQSEDRLPG